MIRDNGTHNCAGSVAGHIVDLENRRIFPGVVCTSGDRIDRIEQRDDVPDQYVIPGFIDAHIHVESTMLPPAEFARWAAPLREMAGDRFPIHGVFLVRATSVEAIIAPSYRLYPSETTEASQIQSALRAYGVRRNGNHE